MATTSSSTSPHRNYSSSSGHGDGREGFFDMMKRQLKQDLAEADKLKELNKELEQDSTMQVAKKTAEEMGKAKEKIGVALDKSSEAIAEKTRQIMQNKFVQSTLNTAEAAADVVGQTTLVKFVMDEYFVNRQELQEFHYHFRSGHGRKKDAEKGVYYNPYTKQMENMEHVTVDEESMGLVTYKKVARKESLSRVKNALDIVSSKVSNSANPLANLTRGLVNSTRSAVDKLGDSVFKANEHTEVLEHFRENDDTFNIETFLGDIEYIMIPRILQSYFEDDVDTLRHYVTDECWRANLYPRIQARMTGKVKFDTVVLDINHVDIMSARFVGEFPVLVISAQVQYIYCVRDEMGLGEIVEGGRDDIRQEGIFFIFRQDPTGETKDWEIMEMSFGGSMRLTS